MTTTTDTSTPAGEDLREEAVQRLKKRQDFRAYDVYGREPIREEEIQREIERLRGA